MYLLVEKNDFDKVWLILWQKILQRHRNRKLLCKQSNERIKCNSWKSNTCLPKWNSFIGDLENRPKQIFYVKEQNARDEKNLREKLGRVKQSKKHKKIQEI